jgi:small subunit ribosomal protein S6
MERNYELVLMLGPEAADADRDRVAEDVRKQIEQAGTLEKADSWGLRKMAYEIKRRNEADYRYFRFTGEKELLERLDHSLKIAEGTLRFRVFKVDPETPSNPPPVSDRPGFIGDGDEKRERRGRRGRDRDRDD